MLRTRPAHLLLEQPPRIEDVLLERCSLGTQRSAIDGMIGVALDVDHLRRHVLRFVADRINEDATTHRTIGTRGSRLGGARNLEFFQLCNRGSQIKSKERDSRATGQRTFEEGSAGEFHRVLQSLRSQLVTTAKTTRPDRGLNLQENIVSQRVDGQSEEGCRTACGARAMKLAHRESKAP